MRTIGAVWRASFAALVLIAGPLPALAGPPYVTDDGEPTDLGHWEIYNFIAGVHTSGDTAGEGGFDLNYGAARDLQLTLVLPAQFANGEETGPGAIEIAAKYRVLHQSPGSWLPDVAIFPRLFAPTTASQFGPARWNLLLPIWAQKDWGPWSLFGGGGYQINPEPGGRNFWQSGLTLTRDVTKRLNLGAEIYYQGAQTRVGRDFTGVNGGAIYKLSNHWQVLLAGGPGVEHARQEGRYDFYLSLEATY